MLHYKQHFYATKMSSLGAYDSCENHEKFINLYRHLTWIVHSVTREKRDVILLANHRPGRDDDSEPCDL